MTNQMHQGQRQFGDNAFGFNRASMQYQNRQLQQDQLNVFAIEAIPDPVCLGLDELDHPVTMARYLNLAGFIS